MNEEFQYDVFLSYSNKDKAIVQPLAERLRNDGLKVWFDDWVLKPGDPVLKKIDDGLETSRVLVLCMSANSFGSDWAQLEAGTFRFRDPLNKERRFIPLRLDDAPIKGSLAQFLFINWLPAHREQEYAKLLETCRPSAKPTAAEGATTHEQIAKTATTLRHSKGTIHVYAFSPNGDCVLTGANDSMFSFWEMRTGRNLKHFSYGGLGIIWSLAWSDYKSRVLTGASDKTLQLWDVPTGKRLRAFVGHTAAVYGVACNISENRALSASGDNTIRLWDLETARCLRVFKGHTNAVCSVVWSPDQRYALSGSDDKTVRLWDLETGRCERVLEGHTERVTCVAWTVDRRLALSASLDHTIRVWNIDTGRCLHMLNDHTAGINTVVAHGEKLYALSGGIDGLVRLWDIENGRCLCVLTGHKDIISTVAWHSDQRHAFSGGDNGQIRVWDLSRFVNQERTPETPSTVLPLAPDQVQYTNAKVLIVGESGVGKTGLSNYLAHGIKVEDDKPLPSTDGVWATHWPLKHAQKMAGVEREIWLWDFAAQVDYRLVHQIYMDDTAAAVLVFNPQNENPFEGLGHWDRDLQKAARKPFVKLLVAARIDRGGLVVSAASMKKFMEERGFLGPLYETSAKTGKGCEQLREAIVQTIDWKSIPETTSPALYHRLKQEILNLRDSGLVLIRLAELKQRMEMTLRDTNFELAELEAVVSLLAGPGMIKRLDFGGFILLRPEVLSRYAAAVVRKVRKHPQELGCIREDELLAGDLDYQDFKRLPREDEAVVLRTLLETFISRAWCLRQPCDGTGLLTFPSYFRRERKEQPSHPSVLVTYRFDGPADDIYATLVVRLHYTVAFNQGVELWKSAADFKTQLGAKLGFTLLRDSEGTSRLEVYFEPDVDGNSRVLFLRYVHDHLMQHAQNVVRLRRYYCEDKTCDGAKEPFPDQAKIDKALAPGGKGKVFCPDCGEAILLRDVIEEKFDSPKIMEQSREMDVEAQTVLDNESRELILVGHAFSIVGEAGQIYRGYTNSDHGIDGEIEFKDDKGRASGKRLYMQLKSGDSYLRDWKGESAEMFTIKKPRHAEYWQQQAYPVMLVIRTSDGMIRWMDVSSYLKAATKIGRPPVTNIVFQGERFDAMSVQNWRKKILHL